MGIYKVTYVEADELSHLAVQEEEHFPKTGDTRKFGGHQYEIVDVSETGEGRNSWKAKVKLLDTFHGTI